MWNDRLGCHYNHEHKHNPHEVDDIFGPPGAWFGGDEISYPWQTFAGANGNAPQWSGNPADLENVAKHAGYGWIVRRDIPPHGGDAWIKDFRLQYHAISAPPGTLTRFHSFSLEAQICDRNEQCGLIRRGGWLDFGNLQVSRAGVVALDGEADAVDDQARRRVHFFYEQPAQRAKAVNKAEFFWYGRNQPTNPPFSVPIPLVIAIATGDAWANVDPANPETLNLFCPDYQCDKNGSTIEAHVIDMTISDPDYEGYTDRYGRAVSGCTQVSLDCIPIIIEHAPVARVQHRDDRDLGLSSAGSQDFDISPAGEWWITYPN